MWKKIAIAVGTLGTAAFVLVGVGAAWFYVSVIRPLRTLPRPEADIVADWERVQPWLPTDLAPDPSDPELARLVDAVRDEGASDGAMAELVEWVDQGGRVPGPGCTLLTVDTPVPGQMDLFEASQQLVEHGEPDAAWELGAQMSSQGVLGLMIGQVIHRSIEPEQPSDPAGLFRALSSDAACSDAVLVALVDGTLGEDAIGDEAAFTDLHVEHLKYRDASARLLLALHPIRDDAAAQRAALEAYEPVESRMSAPVASVLLSGVSTVGVDYLTDPE